MRSIYDIRWCTKSRPMMILSVAVFMIFCMFYMSKDRTRYFTERNDAKNTVPKTMHLVVVSCGRPNEMGVKEFERPLEFSLTMIKSAALFAKSNLHIHIFTEDEIKMRFIWEIESWPEIVRKRVNFTMHSADYTHLLPKELIEEWKAWYKPCGSFRLFLPMLLGNVTDTAIYSDSDIIYLKPIDELWNYFNMMDERHVVGIAPTSGRFLKIMKNLVHFIHHPGIHYPNGFYQINSGIMLLNFTRILNADWRLFDEENTPEIATAKYGVKLLLPYYKKYKDIIEHDQKMLNIMFHFNPDRLLKLPCSWNLHNNYCMDDKNFCVEAKENGIGTVHGVAGSFVYDNKNPAFKKLYQIFSAYHMGEDLQKTVYQPFIADGAQSTNKSCSTNFDMISKTLQESIETVDFISNGKRKN